MKHVAIASFVVASGLALTVPAVQAAGATTSPMKFTVSAKAGPAVDEGTISWKKVATHGTTRTTEVKIETGLSKFSPTHTGGLPTHGRHSHVFYVKTTGSGHLTLTPTRLKAAGAPAGSAAALFFRVWSVNQSGSHVVKRSDGRLHALIVKGRPAVSSTIYRTPIEFASYNIRASRAAGGVDLPTTNNWYKYRQSRVVANIVAAKPDIVAFQEDIPGAEAKYEGPGSTVGQAASLQHLLATNTTLTHAGIAYRLNRSTFYANSKVLQGVRIMYNANKYTMLSHCDDTNFQDSCTIHLPTVSGSTPAYTWASYAQFQDKATGTRFWVVSVYLDTKQSTANASLRARQIKAATAAIASKAAGEPIVLAGDFNDWQNDPLSNGWAPHDALINAGYFDTADAASNSGRQYATTNNFKSLSADPSGVASHFDVIATTNMLSGASSFSNRTFRVNGKWPSDHNMIVARFRLP